MTDEDVVLVKDLIVCSSCNKSMESTFFLPNTLHGDSPRCRLCIVKDAEKHSTKEVEKAKKTNKLTESEITKRMNRRFAKSYKMRNTIAEEDLKLIREKVYNGKSFLSGSGKSLEFVYFYLGNNGINNIVLLTKKEAKEHYLHIEDLKSFYPKEFLRRVDEKLKQISKLTTSNLISTKRPDPQQKIDPDIDFESILEPESKSMIITLQPKPVEPDPLLEPQVENNHKKKLQQPAPPDAPILYTNPLDPKYANMGIKRKKPEQSWIQTQEDQKEAINYLETMYDHYKKNGKIPKIWVKHILAAFDE